MRRLPVIAIFLLAFSVLCPAQVFSGFIKDKTTGEGLAGAFVCAYKEGKAVDYCISGEGGAFSLKGGTSGAADTLRVSLIGYSVYKSALSDMKTPAVIQLKPKRTELKASKVTARAIEDNGDTTRYSVQAFSDGNERSLGELLAKLPGITVSESGGLKVDGKSIGKFYVEGMDLMGSQYGTIVSNLSPDRVQRVEVLRRHQPIRALLGVSPSDRSAVNIILKDSSRDTWLLTGDIAGGAPEFPLFDAKGMITYLSRKRQSLYLAKGNNVGKDLLQELREQEYSWQRRPVVLLADGLDPDFSTPLAPGLSPLSLPKVYWYDNTSGIASLNAVRKTGWGLQVRSSLNLAEERYSENTSSCETVHFEGSTPLTIEERSSLRDKKYLAKGSVMLERNDSARYFSNSLTFSGIIRKSGTSILGAEDCTEDRSLPSFKVVNDLSAVVKVSRRRALNIESRTKVVGDNHEADFTTGGGPFSQLYRLRNIESLNSAGMNLRHGRQLWHLTLSADISHLDISSSLTGVELYSVPLETELGVTGFSPGVLASTSRSFGHSKVQLSLPGKLNILSFGGHHALFPTFSPAVSLTGSISSRLDYLTSIRYTSSRSSGESLPGSAVATSYRVLSVPDSLRKTDTFSVNGRLDYSDNSSLLYAWINASLSRSGSDKTASTSYEGNRSLSAWVPRPLSNNSFGLNASVKKYFGLRTLVATVHSDAVLSERAGFLQGIKVDYECLDLSAGVSLRSNPCDWLSGEVSADYSHLVTSGSASIRSDRITLVSTISVKPVKPLTLKSDLYQFWYRAPGNSISNTPLASLEAAWKFSSFSVFARCTNVLDAVELKNETVSVFRSWSSSRTLSGRRFLVGVLLSM